jgi:hypothetical protein
MRSTPLPIWTAAIPTPPAAANTSSHSPAQQEVLRIFVNYGFKVYAHRLAASRDPQAPHNSSCTLWKALYSIVILSSISHLLEIMGSFGTYRRPGRTKAHLVEAVPDVTSQRFALQKHPVQSQTHGRQAYTGPLGAQQLRFRQTQHPTRTDVGVGPDIFPGTAISVVGFWLNIVSMCVRSGNAHVEKVEPGAMNIDQDVI